MVVEEKEEKEKDRGGGEEEREKCGAWHVKMKIGQECVSVG